MADESCPLTKMVDVVPLHISGQHIPLFPLPLLNIPSRVNDSSCQGDGHKPPNTNVGFSYLHQRLRQMAPLLSARKFVASRSVFLRGLESTPSVSLNLLNDLMMHPVPSSFINFSRSEPKVFRSPRTYFPCVGYSCLIHEASQES